MVKILFSKPFCEQIAFTGKSDRRSRLLPLNRFLIDNGRPIETSCTRLVGLHYLVLKSPFLYTSLPLTTVEVCLHPRATAHRDQIKQAVSGYLSTARSQQRLVAHSTIEDFILQDDPILRQQVQRIIICEIEGLFQR